MWFYSTAATTTPTLNLPGRTVKTRDESMKNAVGLFVFYTVSIKKWGR